MGKTFLILGGIGSFLIALLHLVIPVIGKDAYLYFGGSWLLPLLQQGSPLPALLSLGIAVIFLVWGFYALSGAQILPRLPLLRTGLAAISAIYLLRGLDLIPDILSRIGGSFIEWKFTVFSAVSLIVGLFYLGGIILFIRNRNRSRPARPNRK